MTKGAQDEGDVKFLSHIGKSLIASQVQLGSHEIYIRKNNKINLRKYQSKKKSRGHLTKEIILNNKRIERVSLTYQDYGFINSKAIVSEILELLIHVELHAIDPLRDSELHDLREKLNILMKQSEELLRVSENPQRIRNIFFDILFRSLQQFWLALDRASNIDEFIDILLVDKYVSTGSNDFILMLNI